MPILNLLTFVLWITFWIYWLVSAMGAKKSVGKKSWWVRFLWVRLVLFVLVVFLAFDGHAGFLRSLFYQSSLPISTNILLSVIGVVLCAAGLAFAVWARVYLGTNWGMPMTLREKPELVTSGPYKFVRHPIYTGFLVAMLGTILADGAIWFIILIIAGIYFFYSATVEEKMMAQQFPDAYPAYKRNTKMLVPFIF